MELGGRRHVRVRLQVIDSTFAAALFYLRLGDEKRAKGGRLFKAWQDMDGRGLADEDTVRSPHSA
jgi:hypothetical protein